MSEKISLDSSELEGLIRLAKLAENLQLLYHGYHHT